MMLSRFSRFGTGQCTKPIFLFSLIAITISLIFTTFLITGCTSSSPGIRKFYTLSLSYKADSDLAKLTQDLSSVSDSVKNIFSHDDKNHTTVTLSTVRVGYRGLCVETSDSNWSCTSSSSSNSSTLKIGGDPLDLVSVGELYQAKISFTFPLWVALAFLAIAWLCIIANTIPMLPIPPITRRIGAAASSLATLLLLAALVLQQITNSAVANLVDKLGMGVVEGHAGTAVQAFGWAAFALVFCASLGVAAVVAAEMAVQRAQMHAEAAVAKGLDKATGGRVTVEDVEMLRGFKSNPKAEGGFSATGGFGRGPVKPAKSLSFATNLISKKF